LREGGDRGAPLEFAYATLEGEGRTVYGASAVNYYNVTDHLGSTRMVLSDGGTIVEATAYHAYGRIIDVIAAGQSGTVDPAREKFTGKEFDNDGAIVSSGVAGVGLFYFAARYYDPEVGIFTSADPLDQYANAYMYAGGNPYNRIDPTGCTDCDLKSGVGCGPDDREAYWAAHPDEAMHNPDYLNSRDSEHPSYEIYAGYGNLESEFIDPFTDPVGMARGVGEMTAERPASNPYAGMSNQQIDAQWKGQASYASWQNTMNEREAYWGDFGTAYGQAAGAGYSHERSIDLACDASVHELFPGMDLGGVADATRVAAAGYTDANFVSVNPVGTGTGAILGGLLTGGNPLGIAIGAFLGSLGLFGGVMANADGTIFPYAGFQLSPSVGPTAGGGLTWSQQTASQGFNIAGSLSAGYGGQLGYTFGQNFYFENGPSTPGVGAQFFYSWQRK
jgi:RHS repeat-associated protein